MLCNALLKQLFITFLSLVPLLATSATALSRNAQIYDELRNK